ncbi:MAG: hypothetical protein IIW67_06950 [Peptococcaceae bacterium]|nr:hypothetical protein [Peptococcaceae bacterium]
MAEMICPHCGKTFTPTRATQKFCRKSVVGVTMRQNTMKEVYLANLQRQEDY